MPLQYSQPVFYKQPIMHISNATTGSAIYVAHVVGHHTDRLTILQAVRRSPLLKFTAHRDPCLLHQCTAVSVRVLLTLKDGAGNFFFRLADTCYML